MIGIIKEVAPTAGAETDEKLGVAEFHDKYFPYPLFRDQSLEFYKALGNRKLLNQVFTTNPFTVYNTYQEMKKRLKGRGLKGNMAGEGNLQGGVFVISPLQGVVYMHQEITGQPFPMKEIAQATKSCLQR
jgi:hypothetical protein